MFSGQRFHPEHPLLLPGAHDSMYIKVWDFRSAVEPTQRNYLD